MEKLKIGGIYHFTQPYGLKRDIYIVNLGNNYYFELYDIYSCNTNQEIQEIILELLENGEIYINDFWNFNQQIIENLDGYLGQIDDELLVKLKNAFYFKSGEKLEK